MAWLRSSNQAATRNRFGEAVVFWAVSTNRFSEIANLGRKNSNFLKKPERPYQADSIVKGLRLLEIEFSSVSIVECDATARPWRCFDRLSALPSMVDLHIVSIVLVDSNVIALISKGRCHGKQPLTPLIDSYARDVQYVIFYLFVSISKSKYISMSISTCVSIY